MFRISMILIVAAAIAAATAGMYNLIAWQVF